MDLPSPSPTAFSPPSSSIESKLIVPFNDDTDSGDDNFSDVTEIDDVIEHDDDATNWTFICPLTSKTFPAKSSLNNFWDITFNTTLENIVRLQSPLAAAASSTLTPNRSQDAFLYYCILINHLRSLQSSNSNQCQQSDSHKQTITDEQLIQRAKETIANISPSSEFWNNDEYLFPRIPDDPLIRAFSGWHITRGAAPNHTHDYDTGDDDDYDTDDDGLQENPYQEFNTAHQRFIVGGETVPSHEFLTEQAKSLRDLGAFDS